MPGIFCEITTSWNWNRIKNQISPHFFHYPAKLMQEKGFNVEILTRLRPEFKEPKHEYYSNLEVHRFHKDNRLSLCLGVLGRIVKRHYSLIHLHGITPLGDHTAWFASRLKKTPLVFTSHAPLRFHTLLHSKSPLRRMALRQLFVRNSPTCVFVALTRTQAELYKRLGIRNVRVIPHGIEVSPFETGRSTEIERKFRLEEFNLLCVGTMLPRKGQDLLVRSMPGILKEYPRTKLLLVGRCFYRNERKYSELLKSLVRTMGLADRVEFVTDATRSELIQLYRWATLFVLPTQAEVFSLVLLEAMAAGLPIVTTNTPYLNEILGNGESGILVEREQRALEDAIQRLLGDSKLRKRYAKNGKNLVRSRYRLDNVIRQHWDLYRSLLE